MSAPAQHVDVLVVGLGPAGATAAAAAAKAGARVIAIDRKREAGIPVQCAEFVPSLIAQEAGDVRAALRQPIEDMITFVERDAGTTTPGFRGAMIDRAAFDAKLVADAIAAGAECRFDCALRGFDGEGRAVLANGEKTAARVLIGGDGPRSAVGNAAGLPVTDICETRQATVPLLAAHDATDIFLSGRIPGGYGWLFPKGEVANLGVGVAAPYKQLLKPLLDELIERLAGEGRIGRTVIGYTGGAIPVGGMVGPTGRIGDVPVLLAGDAAGLTNPITGAGINAAVISGTLAGEAAARLLAGRADALDDYADEIAAIFDANLKRALSHRRRLMRAYENAAAPSPGVLRDTWISSDAYWTAPLERIDA